MKRASLLLVLVACSSKPEKKSVPELGIEITVPGDWAKKERNGGIAFSSGLDGVILRGEKEPIKSIEEAKGRLIQGFKLRSEKALPTGGFLFDYDVDFGTKDKPMLLRHITVLLPTKAGHVECTLQLQADQDAGPIEKACASMTPI